jgi:tetratricopeptide (TPR) repeat protein
MPRIKTLTLAMSAVSMMAGCASTQHTGETGLKMEAVQRVTHGQNNPQAFYQLGRYYHGQTRYELALEAYRQAVALQPQYVDALTGMGVAHAMLGQYDDALRVLKAAASIDPASVTAQNNLGYIYWLLNERENAMGAYRAALKLDPMNARARDNLRVAMNGAANAPVPVATEPQPAAAAAVAEAAVDPAASGLQQVAPQVYALRAPAPAVLAGAASADGQARAAGVKPGAATVAIAQAPVGAGLALNEVAPRIYELRAPAQQAERSVLQPEPARAAPAEQARVAAGEADPVSPAAVAYLEVMNGNGVKGLANSVTRYLAAQGYPTLGAGNQPQFNEAWTRIEYRPGHAEQARRLGGMLPVKLALSEVAAMEGQASIRLVLGKDLRHAPANWDLAGRVSPPAGPAVLGTTPLSVANGNGVKGMARKVAGYLADHGYRTTSVYDMRPFNKTVTRIEYRKGYASQAIRLGDLLPGKVAYVESAKLGSGVRLVLGHDIKHNMTAWSPWLEGVKLAEVTDAARL